jgi:hypothetical protein
VIRASEYSSKNVNVAGDPRKTLVNMDMLVTFPEVAWILEAQVRRRDTSIKPD